MADESVLMKAVRHRLMMRPRPRARPDAGGPVRFGSLRRLTPVSRSFGGDRGQPIDRYYIERFLAAHAEPIQGRVLELQDASYTRRFGGERVTRADVLNLTADNPRATIIADLTRADHIPSDTFDCVIFTQALHLIWDVRAAVATLHRILKPGGALLGTFPAISQICRWDIERWGDYWRFTDAAIRRLVGEAFGPANVTVEAHGNVLAAICFLMGLAAHELRADELDVRDPDYQVLITAVAVKQTG